MRKLFATVMAGLLTLTLLAPVTGFAAEEIQLAAVVAANGETSGGAITGGGTSSNTNNRASFDKPVGSGYLGAVIFAGAAAAAILSAGKSSDTPSSHYVIGP